MEPISKHSSAAAIEDVQQRLARLGFLPEGGATGAWDDATERAVAAFCESEGLASATEINEEAWEALVAATRHLGDRALYLRLPHFRGNDVRELQNALGALGFACGDGDGIFGVHTETALRKFQLNMGLPSDGIAGAYTYVTIRNLHHSWEGKEAPRLPVRLGFARVADVLEHHAICLFGTNDFTRSVAARMSNLARATNPASKITSADSLLVTPDENMLLMHIVLPEETCAVKVPRVGFSNEEALMVRLRTAIDAAKGAPRRIALELPGTTWEDAGEDRSAQHFAITALDALCSALAQQ